MKSYIFEKKQWLSSIPSTEIKTYISRFNREEEPENFNEYQKEVSRVFNISNEKAGYFLFNYLLNLQE